jgi:hypothetical protein
MRNTREKRSVARKKIIIIIIIKCSSSSNSDNKYKFKLIKNQETSCNSLGNCDWTEKNLQRYMIPGNRQHILLRDLRDQTGHWTHT